MSLKKLNKITGLEPEKEIAEEHPGPSKSLKETLEVIKKIKLELWEVEHYVDKCEGSEEAVKPQLEEQLMRTKSEMVKLERMLEEEFEAQEDVFED
ncbi:MAG: hypothetical protein ALECFALPRED_002058 [Alectoria fallacina]|uniref:Uncharacterized protein n=1 Tax=Alectoria fallacina TaxID=1903189 RepID=A0A8H3IBU7_9LECA|nr:MAG: hypothetical protein ALECFALPRED_002058 [Alectoria fallacina]